MRMCIITNHCWIVQVSFTRFNKASTIIMLESAYGTKPAANRKALYSFDVNFISYSISAEELNFCFKVSSNMNLPQK